MRKCFTTPVHLRSKDQAAGLRASTRYCAPSGRRDNGASNPFLGLSNTGTPYNTRVRGMVGMLLTFQRFNEQ